MANGFPAATGDIFTAADYNGLVAYTVNADATTDYTESSQMPIKSFSL